MTSSRQFTQTLAAVAFACALSLPYLSFRPVTAAIFILSICANLILRDRRLDEASRAIWLVLPLTALAANVHLFAILVPIWFMALLAGAVWERLRLRDARDVPQANRSIQRYAALICTSLAACLATPMLPGMLRAIVHYGLRDPMVTSSVISEMQPFWSGSAGKISLLLVLGAAACLVNHHRRLRVGELLWLVVSTALLLRMGKFAPVFALIAAPALAVTLPKLSDAVLARPFVRASVAVILCLGLLRVAMALPSSRTELDGWLNRHGVEAPGYPTAAARFVSSDIERNSGRIINEFNWGGYLAWRLEGRYQVLLDGRTQVYSPEFWQETYLGDERSRRRLLKNVHADAAILPVEKSVFRSALLALGWKTVHRDDRAVVMVPPARDVVTVD